MLNPAKTEFLWLSTHRRKHLIKCVSFTLNSVDIVPSTVTCLHGIRLDETLSPHGHKATWLRFASISSAGESHSQLHLNSRSCVFSFYLIQTIATASSSSFWTLSSTVFNQIWMLTLIWPSAAIGTIMCLQLWDKLHWLYVSKCITFKWSLLTSWALYDPSALTISHSSPGLSQMIVIPNSTPAIMFNTRSPPTNTAKFSFRWASHCNQILCYTLQDKYRKAISTISFKWNPKTHLFQIFKWCLLKWPCHLVLFYAYSTKY